jgi:hypothetical protein
MKLIRVVCWAVGTIILATFLTRLSTPTLDFFFLDWRQILMNGKAPENPFVILNVSKLKLAKPNHQFTPAEFISLVKEVDAARPKTILISIAAEEILRSDDFPQIEAQLSQMQRVFVIERPKTDRKTSFASDPSFTNYKNLFHIELTNDSRYDRVSRRIITYYDLERKESDRIFEEIGPLISPAFPISHFSKDFEYFGTKQIYLKIWPDENFNEENLATPTLSERTREKLKDKVVILGTEDIYALMSSPSIIYRRSFFQSSDTFKYIWQDTKLAATFLTNLISGEYIKSPTSYENGVWICFWLLLNLGIIFFAPIKKALWISFGGIGIFVVASLLLFKITDTNFDMGRILVTTLLFQYVILSIRFISYIRKSDAAKIRKDSELAVQKMKNSFLVRVAQADLSLKVAAQVSHDIRTANCFINHQGPNLC